jgi:hypothetical protein
LFSLGVFPGRSVCVSAQLTHSLPIGEAAVSSHEGEYCPVLASLMIAPTSKYIRPSSSLLLLSSSCFSLFFLLFFSLYSFCFVCCSRTSSTTRIGLVSPLRGSYVCVHVLGCIHLSELVLPSPHHPHAHVCTFVCVCFFSQRLQVSAFHRSLLALLIFTFRSHLFLALLSSLYHHL